MCGIIGYVGARETPLLLVEGLKRLEYRGYDSCGIGLLSTGGRVLRRRVVGGVDNLERTLRDNPLIEQGLACGIGHTRWATHGCPSEINAHPHCDCSGRFLVVHNGIIENHYELRRRLESAGHCFESGTDSEVLAHLIEAHFAGSLEGAVRAALQEVEGMYALVALSTRDRLKLVAARRGPPLVVGRGDDENFLASDAAALLAHTREILFLGDGEVAVVRRDSVDVCDSSGVRTARPSQMVTWSAEMAEKNGYPHFMLKEIDEQPRAVRHTLDGRITPDGTLTLQDELPADPFQSAGRIHLLACGTSLHAAHLGRFYFESLAGIPTEADYASEFRYRKQPLDRHDLVIAISQSGETADTLGAVEEAKRHDACVVSVSNVVGSSLPRSSDGVLYTRAGPEIGVASTKAFTTQLVALYLLALYAGRNRGALSADEVRKRVRDLRAIPDQIEQVLSAGPEMAEWTERLGHYANFLYLGRGPSYPIALEGALKLKEISYIHAEGYPAGEMKHGPLALVAPEVPVLVVAPRDAVYTKTLGNIEEAKGRGATVLAVVTAGDKDVAHRADLCTSIPHADPLLAPLLAVVPLQLFAYHVAVFRGCDVDRPRNLAKTVTVE